ncbi:MAG: YqgQ family protein [Heyndrickxia sp.]
MKTVYDVQQLLKRFGMIIYVGERLSDLELMESEIKELYKMGLIQKEDFQMALLILRMEIGKEKSRGKG